jgi:Periplasmic serine proteases (ClpP class)
LNPLSDDAKTWAENILNQTTHELQTIISSSRGSKLNKEKAFTGDLFNGQEANELGLVDKIGNCDEVISAMFPQTQILEITRRTFGSFAF